MPTFSLTIDTSNDAFTDPGELPRILAKLAQQVADRPEGWDCGNVRDVNGNNVGDWSITS